MTPKKTLTDQQRRRFTACVKIVKDGLETCFGVGMALIEIRDSNLYQEDFDTFEEFTKEIFGMERAHAYRLIDAFEVKKSISMSPMGDKITNERQARALSKVPEKERVKTVEKAAAKGDVTAKTIEESYEPTEPPEMNEPEKEKVTKDSLGWPIPKESLGFWHRRDELTAFLPLISTIKRAVEKGRDSGDPLFTGLNASIIGELKTLYWRIKQGLPYAVCTTCNGRPELNGSCIMCHSTGFIPEDLPKSNPYVADVLKIRAKSLAVT